MTTHVETHEELRQACIKELKQRASTWRIKGNHFLADAYDNSLKNILEHENMKEPSWLTDDVRERLHDRFDIEAYEDGIVKLTPKKRG